MKKLPPLPILLFICTFNFVIPYYRHFIQIYAYHLTYTTEIYAEKVLGTAEVPKAAGLVELLVRFLRVSSKILSKPISELYNLSIKLGSFPDPWSIAKLKSLFKKVSKTLTILITGQHRYYL